VLLLRAVRLDMRSNASLSGYAKQCVIQLCVIHSVIQSDMRSNASVIEWICEATRHSAMRHSFSLEVGYAKQCVIHSVGYAKQCVIELCVIHSVGYAK